MRFDLELLIWLAGTAVLVSPVLFVLRRRGHTWPYLVAFFVLTVYLSLVARETQVYHSVPGDESSTYGFSSYVNLVPGMASPHHWSGFNLEQVFINILLGVPLGFGLNFVRLVRLRTLPWIALGFGFAIEVLQLLVSLIVGHPRHIADVNDMLLNASGVVIGYSLFRAFAWVYWSATCRRHRHPGGLLAYLDALTARGRGGKPR
jgi:glycopeptide antibiotics resistance protein